MASFSVGHFGCQEKSEGDFVCAVANLVGQSIGPTKPMFYYATGGRFIDRDGN